MKILGHLRYFCRGWGLFGDEVEVGHESKAGTGKPPALAGDPWIPQGAEVTAEPCWECHSRVLSQDG